MSSLSKVGTGGVQEKKPPPPPKPKLTQDFAKALFEYTATDSEELSFKEGDVLYIVEKNTVDGEWWKARLRGRDGFVPSNYLQMLDGGDLKPSLHDACRRGNLELLQECLDNRLPVNATDKADNTAVHYACHSGNLECLRMLLERVDTRILKLDLANRMGETPVHMAAARGHAHIIRELRDHEHRHNLQIDLEAKNGDGKTAMDSAVQSDVKAELIKWGISRNADTIRNLTQLTSRDYADSDDEEE